jgi:hypothetical protein
MGLPLALPLRPTARLALLSALASYQVDQQIISAFRQYQPGDRDLVNVTAWASWVAARRIASWLNAPDARS